MKISDKITKTINILGIVFFGLALIFSPYSGFALMGSPERLLAVGLNVINMLGFASCFYDFFKK